MAWLEARAGRVHRDLPTRRTFEFEHAGARWFAKIHLGVGERELFKNLLVLRLPVFGAEAELGAIARLDAAGLPTLSVAAWGVSRDLLPTRRRSFLVTRAIEHDETLEDRVRARFLDPSERRDRIRDLAGLVRRMHEAGVNHRDLYLVHVLLTGDGLRLIDLHRAQVRGAVPRRWRAKDLAALVQQRTHYCSFLSLAFSLVFSLPLSLCLSLAPPAWARDDASGITCGRS